MKLLAVIQILSLLICIFIPEDQFSLNAASCTTSCGCSKQMKQTGTCCCSSNNRSRDNDRKTCCASKHNSAAAKHRRQTPEFAACPCENGDSKVAVVYAPKTRPGVTTLTWATLSAETWLLSNDRCDNRSLPPDVPPPQYCSC